MTKTPSTALSKLICFINIALFSLVLTACVDDDGSSSQQADYQALLTNVADNVIIPRYNAFADSSAELNDLISNYCTAIDSSEEAQQRLAAQRQWTLSALDWQQTELFIVGPAADHDQAIRNNIHVFSENINFSSCSVDQAVALNVTDNSFSPANRQASQRGIDALEYLLFNNNLNHNCPSQVSELTDWNALSESVKKQRRCDYAIKLAEDLNNNATTLVKAWSKEQDNFRSSFITEANIGSQIAALSDALFYIDIEIKDLKLEPATSGNAYVESPYSQQSLSMIKANLEGFKAIFYGNGGYSFDDMMIEAGFTDIAQSYATHADAAIAVIDALEANNVSLTSAAASIDNAACVNAKSNPDNATNDICKLYGLVKRISDSLKTDFVTIVNLDIPDRAQSDND